jgi:YidC/Oxa1 family membrane protein insertase
MERRVLFAIFLCFLVLYLWEALVVKPVPKPGTAGGPTSSASSAATAPSATPSAGEVTKSPGGVAAPSMPPTATPAAGAAQPVLSETTERDIRVETKDVIAIFTNRGARLKSWRLKRYLDPKKQPQELIESEANGRTLPFTLRTPDEQVNTSLNAALYAVSGVPPGGAAPSAPVDLRFEYRDSAGLHAVKQFHLDSSSFVVSFSDAVAVGERALPAAIVWGPAVGDIGAASRVTQAAEGLLFQNGSPVRLSASALAKQPAYDGSYKYAGVDDNYFMVVALDPGPAKVSYQAVSIPPPPGSKDKPRPLLSFTLEPVPGAAQAKPVKFFVGPKDLDVLNAIDPDLGKAINFGWFAIIVVPLLQSLKWVHRFVGNWGWSIVILTLIINLVTAPLRHKQVVSMRKMQEIQPEIKAIQDRYSKLKATDPAKQKMNTEMMALYKEKKVNPASGCIPMLLTFPIMLAMWAVLETSIELRGEPWLGWIHDLAAPDPLYLLPVMMVVTQFLQQAMMPPAGADPAQQKMMKFMPVVMGFLFFSLPAGALLYYVASSVVGIGQQAVTNYLIGPPPVHNVRPAAERRVKRAGSGKTDAASREP